ncbi:MAG: sigma-70 family RNA polymerase sigma factor [Bacteroidales bacterium]|nr:sigma-70 family RNA polymerase sigma factor [Bacteroidales bacterium]
MTSANPIIYSIDMLLAKGLQSDNPEVQRTCVERIFYKDLAGLISVIRRDLFKNTIDYDDIVGELYLHLSKNHWRVLNSYRGEAKFSTWVSRVAWRYFTKVYLNTERICLDENYACYNDLEWDVIKRDEIRMDISKVLSLMPNRKYAEVLRLNVIEGYDFETISGIMGTNVPNVYNIKSRALRQFLSIYEDMNDRKEQ